MPQRALTPEQLLELRQLAAQWGKTISRRAFGEDGPGLDVDFALMEQIAQAAAQGITEGTLQSLLEQQSDTLGEQQPCPHCGHMCPMRREPRDLQAKGVKLEQNEPVAHCPACRRDFFPSASHFATQQSRL